MEFSVHCTFHPPRAFLAVCGELDIGTIGHLARRFADVHDLECRDVTLDVGDVTFIDGGSLRVIATAQETVLDAGGSFRIVRAPERFRCVCRMARFDGLAEACTSEAEQPA